MKGFPKLKLKSKNFLTKIFATFGLKLYLGLLLIAVLLFAADFKVNADLNKGAVLGVSYPVEKSEYPVLKTTYVPQITARGAVVMDADSKVILYQKNPNLRFSSASTVKIMTAITALDYFNLHDFLTVKKATTEGVILGLKDGQKITFENLLYALLLPSANDIALTIAQNFSSSNDKSEDAFIKKMNQNTVKFNLYNTHYEDPAGLLDDGDYTTPLDLARLSSIAIKNEVFAKIVSTREKTINDYDGNNYSLKNLNKLLGFENVNGIKTGTTQGAGQVLVTSKKEGEHTIIIVVMDSEDRFSDTKKLLNMISGNITYLPIHP